MKIAFILLALLAQIFMVIGQIFLKRAMAHVPAGKRLFAGRFFSAIAAMTLYFFLWLGLMAYVPLSQLASFDALGPVLLVATVSLFFRERLTPRAWFGVILILTGISAIALS